MKKKSLAPIVAIAAGILFFVIIQSYPSHEETEEKAQIENVERLSNCPTYYVDGVSDPSDKEEGIFYANLYRKNAADGTIPDSILVKFDEQQTPSILYLKAGDSIKIDLEVITDEYRLDGRYQIFKTYEASLFIFVDQIPILTEKYKQDNN